MDQSQNIMYFGVFNDQKNQAIVDYNHIKSQQIELEAIEICNELRIYSMSEWERKKVSSKNGIWYCMVNPNNFFFVAENNYQENLAYQLIQVIYNKFSILQLILQQINDYLVKQIDYQTQKQDKIKSYLQKYLKEQCIKYCDASQVDQLQNAKAKVNNIQIQMEENIRLQLQSNQFLDKLSADSLKLQDQSKQFNKDSKNLANVMYWRQMRLKIIFAIIIFAVLCYIFIPMVVSVDVVTS